MADGVKLLELVTADGRPLPPFVAGDHIVVELGARLRRSYSLIGPPCADAMAYRVAVALNPAGRGGSIAAHALQPGQSVRISPPASGFPLVRTAAPTILIAGGIGITPMVAMVHQLMAWAAPWRLHYAFRSPAAAAFVDELVGLGSRDPGAASLYPDDAAGRPTLDVAKIVSDAPADAHLYCCGPEPMLDAFLDACRAHDERRVHIERFAAPDDTPISTDRSGPHEDQHLTVQLARSGRMISVAPQESILEALLDAGESVDFSCMEGICGSCRTRVVEGIPEHRDAVLTDSERAAGDAIMICCSRAKGDRLVLDI
ncbi:PDR/VanB family oxidoreductase [Dactylosporangium sp. NPDC051485]|uniref:PDR/VanB family oxidoreductase n=1 Tax=Dactylosporangium sp. NPDC051485 TaxID=3154846 RepID=UPI003433A7B2